MKFKILLISILLCTSIFSQETLQPYHWANSYIDYFIVRGDLTDLNKLNRPFSRMAVTKALLKLDLENSNYSSKEKGLIKLLLREFEFEGKQLVKKESGSGWLYLMNKAMSFLGKSKDKIGFKVGAYGIAGYNSYQLNDSSFGSFQLNPNATLSWQEIVTLQFNGRIFNKAPQNYIGEKFLNLYMFTEQAYIKINTDWLDIKFGRDYLQLGPGQTGQLLFSDNSHPFNMYHFRIGKSNINLSFWGITLDPVSTRGTQHSRYSNAAIRYLNGHRINFNISDRYRFAVSEVVLYGGANQHWYFGYINPFTIYSADDLNDDYVDTNILYNIEWDLYPLNNVELYGEFLIDNLYLDEETSTSLNTKEFGILAGVKWASPFEFSTSLLNFEYVQVRNRTYNSRENPWLKYLHRNQVMGYALGNNLEHYFGSFSWWPHPELKMELIGGLFRQGEGSVYDDLGIISQLDEDKNQNDFPAGVIETDFYAGINFFYKPSNFGHLELDISNHSYKNYLNINDNDDNDLRVKLNLWLQWDYIFEPDKE